MRPFVAAFFFALALGVTAEAKDKWFEARSPHFTVVTNGRQGRAKEILEDLEQLRRLIKEINPAQRVDSSKPAVFYLFKNEKSMRPFQPTEGGEREEWAGMYRPMWLRNIVLVRGDGSSESVRKLAFGQYMHLLEDYNEADYPVWLSNGLSRFYGNTEISDKQARIGKMRQEYRRELGRFRSVPVRELFAVDRSSAYYRDLNIRPLFDTQSWALVHYILIGKAKENGAQRLGRYLRLLRQGGEPLQAFQEAMGRSLDEIDQEVAFYIRKDIALHIKVNLRPLEMDKDFQITQLDPAAVKGHEGQLYTAARYYEEAEKSLVESIETSPGQVLAYEAMASLRDRQGKSEEVESLLQRTIENGSSNPHVHLRHAQLFVSSHSQTTAESAEETTATVMESLRFVIREAPELTDAARLLGYLALFSEAAREEGLQVVADALERDPSNSSLVFMLGQLRAKEGAYAAARMIFSELLNRKLEPGFKAAVRRQYDYVDAQIELEAQRRAEATSATHSQADETVVDRGVAAATDEGRDPVQEKVAGKEMVEVRGTLVQFDCNDGHRFIVEAEGLTYALDVVDLNGVMIFENGEHVDNREFYCGPLDERVIVRYFPAPVDPGAEKRTGRLASIHFIVP